MRENKLPSVVMKLYTLPTLINDAKPTVVEAAGALLNDANIQTSFFRHLYYDDQVLLNKKNDFFLIAR